MRASALLALTLAVAPAPARDDAADPITVARTRLAATRTALAALTRDPPGLALATGGSITDVVHRRIAAQALAREVRRQEDALMATLAREQGEARHADEVGIPVDQAEPDAERLTRLAALPGPAVPPDTPRKGRTPRRAPLYRMPARGQLLIGTGERSDGDVRARGITLATAPGLPVAAPGAGRVRYAGPFGAYGDIVIIDHGHGWTTLVAGLDRASVAVDDDLFAGVAIGRTTHRLLVELRHSGRVVDIVGVAALLDR